MSDTATTCASSCARNALSTWSPRLPTPMKPRRTRLLGAVVCAVACAGLKPAAAPTPIAAAALVKSRRVIEDMSAQYCAAVGGTQAAGRRAMPTRAGRDRRASGRARADARLALRGVVAHDPDEQVFQRRRRVRDLRVIQPVAGEVLLQLVELRGRHA